MSSAQQRDKQTRDGGVLPDVCLADLDFDRTARSNRSEHSLRLRFLAAGDVVTVSIDRLGTVETREQITAADQMMQPTTALFR